MSKGRNQALALPFLYELHFREMARSSLRKTSPIRDRRNGGISEPAFVTTNQLRGASQWLSITSACEDDRVLWVTGRQTDDTSPMLLNCLIL